MVIGSKNGNVGNSRIYGMGAVVECVHDRSNSGRRRSVYPDQMVVLVGKCREM